MSLLLFILITLTVRVSSYCRPTFNEFERDMLNEINNFRRLHKDTPDLCYGESDIFTVEAHLRWYEKYVRKARKTGNGQWHAYENFSKVVDNMIYSTCRTWGDHKISFKEGLQRWYDTIGTYSWKLGILYGQPEFKYLVNSKAKELNCGFYYHGWPSGIVVHCQIWPKVVDRGYSKGRSPDQNFLKQCINPLKNPEVVRPFLVIDYVESNATIHNLLRKWEIGYKVKKNNDKFRWQDFFNKIIPKARKFYEDGTII